MNKAVASLALLLFISNALSQSADEKKATIAYLRALQVDSGGFLPAKPDPKVKDKATPTLHATSAAVRAFGYLGGEPRDSKAAAKFIADCFDKKSGGFADTPGGQPTVFTTAVGLLAVVQLKMPAETYAEPATKFLGENVKSLEDIRIAAAGLEGIAKRPNQADAWLKQLEKARNKDGTFGKDDGAVRDTGSLAVAGARLAAADTREDNNREKVMGVLKAGQRPDGGFGKAGTKESDLDTSYRVTRALLRFKAAPDKDKLRTFVSRCRNADGGYGMSAGQSSNAGATYFASIILHWMDEK